MNFIKDTQFYWNNITQELNGNMGTNISYELLQTHGERTEIAEHDPRTELYFYANLFIDWDALHNRPISVINVQTEAYLFLSSLIKKGARKHARKSGDKRITSNLLMKRLNRKPSKQAKMKRRLRNFKARRN